MTGIRALRAISLRLARTENSVPHQQPKEIRAKIPVHMRYPYKKQFQSREDWKLALVDSLFI
jgi:hypothetical protein